MMPDAPCYEDQVRTLDRIIGWAGMQGLACNQPIQRTGLRSAPK